MTITATSIDSTSVGDPARFLTLAELERRLDGLPRAPADAGRVALVVRRGAGGRARGPRPSPAVVGRRGRGRRLGPAGGEGPADADRGHAAGRCGVDRQRPAAHVVRRQPVPGTGPLDSEPAGRKPPTRRAPRSSRSRRRRTTAAGSSRPGSGRTRFASCRARNGGIAICAGSTCGSSSPAAVRPGDVGRGAGATDRAGRSGVGGGRWEERCIAKMSGVRLPQSARRVEHPRCLLTRAASSLPLRLPPPSPPEGRSPRLPPPSSRLPPPAPAPRKPPPARGRLNR